MAKYGMAIKLDTCVGCGACALACKTENNTQYEDLTNGRKFNWIDFLNSTEGTFPNVAFKVKPVQCNHCTNAPCVTNCLAPEDPSFNNNRAMYKTADGITMHSDDRCIGCQNCITHCPYSDQNTISAAKQYSVLSFNPFSPAPHSFWADTTAILDGTSTPAEVATAAGYIPAYKNDYITAADKYYAVRPGGVTEKCIFCEHRVLNGDEPYCVVSCPTNARIFGDLDDSGSDISIAIAASGYTRLADNTGTEYSNQGNDPNVYYLGDFFTDVADVVIKEPASKIIVFPNPVSTSAQVEFELVNPSKVSFSIFDVSGKEVKRVVSNEPKTFGTHRIPFDVSGLKSGTYICRLQTEDKAMTTNIVVVR